LPPGGAVLDLGCGHGAPISQALTEDGFVAFGVDVAPSMVAAFQERLPGASVTLVGEYEDEGNNHYFDATKP
jgi:cyclopropane fatty-acyl-phospholipid synthase-like methyltransferase